MNGVGARKLPTTRKEATRMTRIARISPIEKEETRKSDSSRDSHSFPETGLAVPNFNRNQDAMTALAVGAVRMQPGRDGGLAFLLRVATSSNSADRQA